MVDLTTSVGTVRLANPILLASGCAGYGEELDGLVDLDELGGLVTKGVSRDPWDGNPPPRIAETASGMLNAIGLQNTGLEGFLAHKAPSLEHRRCAVVVNVIGRCVQEYAEVAAALCELPFVDALELNISCPNIKAGGIQFGTRPDAAAGVTRAVVDASTCPVWVKLAPTVADIGEMARAVQGAGAAALTVSNTIPALAVDLDRRAPRLGNVVGGLSGPAIKPVALRLVWECVRAVSIPVVGCGGISSGRDALEFLVLGARAVQVGTATLVEPAAGRRIVTEMADYLRGEGLSSVQEIIGTFRPDMKSSFQ
jgi:dihydroorotate dehydrogenase (NAD+) catalytic subunit